MEELQMHSVRCRYFQLFEVVFAAVLLGISTTAIFSGMRMLVDMRRAFWAESAALVVADNAVQRLSLTGQPPTFDELKKTLLDESQKNQLQEQWGVSPEAVATLPTRASIYFRDVSGRSVLDFEVTLHVEKETR
jgi:type II secretory pathway pseudopilin PulG